MPYDPPVENAPITADNRHLVTDKASGHLRLARDGSGHLRLGNPRLTAIELMHGGFADTPEGTYETTRYFLDDPVNGELPQEVIDPVATTDVGHGSNRIDGLWTHVGGHTAHLLFYFATGPGTETYFQLPYSSERILMDGFLFGLWVVPEGYTLAGRTFSARFVLVYSVDGGRPGLAPYVWPVAPVTVPSDTALAVVVSTYRMVPGLSFTESAANVPGAPSQAVQEETWGRRITYTWASGLARGVYTPSFGASNVHGAATARTATITVTGRPPMLSAIGALSAIVGKVFSHTVTTSRTDGDVVTLAVSGAPAGSTFTGTELSKSLFWNRPETNGTHQLTFTATDADGTTSEAVNLTVAWPTVVSVTDVYAWGQFGNVQTQNLSGSYSTWSYTVTAGSRFSRLTVSRIGTDLWQLYMADEDTAYGEYTRLYYRRSGVNPFGSFSHYQTQKNSTRTEQSVPASMTVAAES